mmetsp:Transcript_87133/g.247309  ORF Transcript_87133/g.247309 Transcript_87133/m.247309 type:complete len:169 (-) Transcript_87133:2103-2609(-)
MCFDHADFGAFSLIMVVVVVVEVAVAAAVRCTIRRWLRRVCTHTCARSQRTHARTHAPHLHHPHRTRKCTPVTHRHTHVVLRICCPPAPRPTCHAYHGGRGGSGSDGDGSSSGGGGGGRDCGGGSGSVGGGDGGVILRYLPTLTHVLTPLPQLAASVRQKRCCKTILS